MQDNLLNPTASGEFLEESQDVTMDDPQLQQLQGTEEATPEEEQALGEGLIKVREFLYSDEGLAAVANMLKSDPRELWEKIPEAGMMILEKVHGEMPDADPAIFFGEGGLLQQVPPMLFEVAEQLNLPGADNPDHLSASVIGLYKAAGEYLIERGDEGAQQEAQRLGEEVLLTQEDGSMMSPEQFGKNMTKKAPAMKQLPADVKGLLGV